MKKLSKNLKQKQEAIKYILAILQNDYKELLKDNTMIGEYRMGVCLGFSEAIEKIEEIKKLNKKNK